MKKYKLKNNRIKTTMGLNLWTFFWTCGLLRLKA